MSLRNTLSTRELENVKLAAKGLLYKQIAYDRGVTEDTVKKQMRSAREKMQMATTKALIALAIREGLVSES